MIKPSSKEISCPSCNSSLKKIISSESAFCPSCFDFFDEEIAKYKHCNFKSISPKIMNSALKNEDYETAAQITKSREIKNILPHSIFTSLHFKRNLLDSTFKNSENLTKRQITKNSQIINELIISIKKNNSVNINLNSINHLEMSSISFNNDLCQLNDLQQHMTIIDANLKFAFSEKFGFLGPNNKSIGHAFTLKTALALPHLYYDGQIPKIIKACSLLGYNVYPWIYTKENPLIYIFESDNSLERSHNDTLKELSHLTEKIFYSEKHAFNKFNESECTKAHNHLANKYWSCGALMSPTSSELLSIYEGLLTAYYHNYLSNNYDSMAQNIRNVIKKMFFNQTLYNQNQGIESPGSEFEKLLLSMHA